MILIINESDDYFVDLLTNRFIYKMSENSENVHPSEVMPLNVPKIFSLLWYKTAEKQEINAFSASFTLKKIAIIDLIINPLVE